MCFGRPVQQRQRVQQAIVTRSPGGQGVEHLRVAGIDHEPGVQRLPSLIRLSLSRVELRLQGVGVASDPRRWVRAEEDIDRLQLLGRARLGHHDPVKHRRPAALDQVVGNGDLALGAGDVSGLIAGLGQQQVVARTLGVQLDRLYGRSACNIQLSALHRQQRLEAGGLGGGLQGSEARPSQLEIALVEGSVGHRECEGVLRCSELRRPGQGGLGLCQAVGLAGVLGPEHQLHQGVCCLVGPPGLHTGRDRRGQSSFGGPHLLEVTRADRLQGLVDDTPGGEAVRDRHAQLHQQGAEHDQEDRDEGQARAPVVAADRDEIL